MAKSNIRSNEIKEALFLYPIPIAELADRNFNVWVKEQKASFSRLNLGTYTYWLNATGRAELMKFTVLFGYTNKFEFNYIIFYIQDSSFFYVHKISL